MVCTSKFNILHFQVEKGLAQNNIYAPSNLFNANADWCICKFFLCGVQNMSANVTKSQVLLPNVGEIINPKYYFRKFRKRIVWKIKFFLNLKSSPYFFLNFWT